MGRLTTQRLNAIRQELEAINASGILTPEEVVERARNPANPLHDQFEWNDGTAAEAFRLQQARGLIKRVNVEVVRADQTTVVVPAFIRSPIGDGYALTQTVAVSAPDRSAVIAITLRQISTMLRNLAAPELDVLVAHVDAVLAEVASQKSAA